MKKRIRIYYLTIIAAVILKLSSTGLASTSISYTNAGNNTWTCPPGVLFISVECYGGGGGAGGAGDGKCSSGGGSGGAYASNTVPVIPGRKYFLTVGAGGKGSSSGKPVDGGMGGASYFGNANPGVPNGALVLAVGGNGSTNAVMNSTGANELQAMPLENGNVVMKSTGIPVNGYGGAAPTSGCIGALIYYPLDGEKAGAGGGGKGSAGAGPTGPEGGGLGGGQEPKQKHKNPDGSKVKDKFDGVRPGHQPGGGGAGGFRLHAAVQGHGGAGGTGEVVITYRLTPEAMAKLSNPQVSYTGLGQAAPLKLASNSVPGYLTNVQYNGFANLPVTVGTYAVTADFIPADSTSYSSLRLNAGNFVINRAYPAVSLVLINSTVTYDGTPKAAALMLADGSTPGMVTNVMIGGAPSQTSIGTYPVTAQFIPDDQNDYYATNIQVGTLQIAPVATILYSHVGSFTYDGTGHAPVVQFAGSTGSGTTSFVGVSLNYDSVNPPTNAGTYYITNTLAGDAHYAGATNSLTFCINPAPLTIQANNINKDYQQTLRFAGTEFTTLPVTLLGNDAVTHVTLSSDGTRAFAPTGPYPISATNALGNGLANYAISYNPGTLTVTNGSTPLYVSPAGRGADFTPAHPGALVDARNYVRSMGTNLTADVIIYLTGGTYQMTNSFVLEENATNHDSGSGGHYIIYQNAPGQTPVISGGMVVTNWSLYDPVTNIWRAYVGLGVNSRQLFVNGQRAIRARGPVFPSTDGGFAPGFGHNKGGFWTTNTAMQHWRNPTNVEFVQRWHYEYHQALVSEIHGTNITLHSFAGPGLIEAGPSWIVNAYELMTSPGMWYLDQATGWLYYIPRPGENMASAEADLPIGQTLVNAVGGASTAPIHNIILSGLTFEHSTFNPIISQNLVNNGVNPGATVLNNGALRFTNALHIVITNCVFKHLGSTAIRFTYSYYLSVIGCLFDDISETGIAQNKPVREMNPSSLGDNVILNNYFRREAMEYEFGRALAVGRVTWLIAHNDIDNTAYSGITGGGNNSLICSNYFGCTCNTLWDGGSTYTSGNVTNTFISYNYLKNGLDHGIYYDIAANGWVSKNNVLDNFGWWWVYWHHLPQFSDYAYNTYYNASGGSVFNVKAPQITGSIHVNGQFWPPAAQQIIINAGLEPAFWALKSQEFFVNDTEPAFDVVPSDWQYILRPKRARYGEYDGDVHICRRAGDTLKYTFTATGITWIGNMNVDASTNVAVYLDGNLQQNVNTRSGTFIAQARLFTATNLVPGVHTIQLVNRHAGGILYLDAFAVVPNQFWLTASPNSAAIKAGNSFTNVIRLEGFAGYSKEKTTTFKAVGLPSGATASFNPPSLTGPGFATMTLHLSANTPLGATNMTVLGIGGGVTNIVETGIEVVSSSHTAPVINQKPDHKPHP